MKTRQNVQDTSIQAFIANKPDLETLKGKVYSDLKEFQQVRGHWPTYNELQRYMVEVRPDVTWRTQIQPRLTRELVDEGLVEEAGKRECRVSGEKIQTWKTAGGLK